MTDIHKIHARVAGERVRLTDQIARIRALVDGLEITLRCGGPITESAQAVADSSIRLATTAARFDAYERAVTDLEI